MGPTAARAHVIRVLTMSPGAAERFRAAPLDAGRVHSVYARALNLCWHDGRLLTLHGPGRLLAPFAAALAEFPTEAVRPGLRARRCGDTIMLDGTVLEWRGAVIVDTAMPESSGGPGPVAGFLSALPHVEGGPGLSSAIGRRARLGLAEGLLHREARTFIEGALGLVGLGEGLTPAGDDCVVGALAVTHRFAGPWLRAHPEIEAVVGGAAAHATTAVAREFVTHALAGHFAESLVDLMTAASAEETGRATAELLRTGATSGADTLCGVRLALAALEESAMKAVRAPASPAQSIPGGRLRKGGFVPLRAWP